MLSSWVVSTRCSWLIPKSRVELTVLGLSFRLVQQHHVHSILVLELEVAHWMVDLGKQVSTISEQDIQG